MAGIILVVDFNILGESARNMPWLSLNLLQFSSSKKSGASPRFDRSYNACWTAVVTKGSVPSMIERSH